MHERLADLQPLDGASTGYYHRLGFNSENCEFALPEEHSGESFSFAERAESERESGWTKLFNFFTFL